MINIVLLGYALNSFCQNLVPNNSFEKCNKVVDNWISTHTSFERAINDWNVPNEGSPDILFEEKLGRMKFKRPKVDLTPYHPRTGKVVLGLKLYGCENGQHCKEYIQVKLREPLHKGKKYYLEFWVKPINTSIKINNIGAVLLVKKNSERAKSGIYDVTPVVNYNKIIDPNSSDTWVRISDTICANRSYEYLSIGNFYPDSETLSIHESNGLDYAFYLLDDVLLKKVRGECDFVAPIEDVIDVSNIRFEFNSAVLSINSFSELDNLVSFLKAKESIRIEVRGYTDNSGSLKFNENLSIARANSVVQYLISKGITSDRLETKGLGELAPIADNNTEAGRTLNRRVEIEVTPKF